MWKEKYIPKQDLNYGYAKFEEGFIITDKEVAQRAKKSFNFIERFFITPQVVTKILSTQAIIYEERSARINK